MNRLTAGILAAMTAVLLIVPAGAQKKSEADTMFEVARQKEILEGDLNGAIKQYGAIVTKYVKSDRAVTAMALVHIAECYRKMGDSESRKIFEQVVSEYSDQKDAVAIARAQLGRAASSGALAKRLLCADCGDEEGDFSPDGRLMVYTDWDSGDLAIRDMSTGRVGRLMAKTGTWTDTNDAFAERPVFSPDLRQILYFWDVGNKEDDEQLRVMQNEPGGKSRVLINRNGDNNYWPRAWFPDGKSVLGIQSHSKDQTAQIVRLSVPDGAVKVLKSLEWRLYRISGLKPSPDGRFIVYSALAANPSKFPPAATDPKDQHIYLLAADGSTETEVVKTSGINRNPVWTPDGKHILFTSDRSGKFDLWSIAVQDGKAIGAASLVSAEFGNVNPVGMYGGSYYYTNSGTAVEYVNIAEFAPSGNSQGRIAHPTEIFIGVRAAWSPDSKSISFKRHHPGSVNDDYDLVVHSLETGDERTYLTNLGTSGWGRALWFHNSKTITTGIGPDGRSRVNARVDLKTGEFKALTAAVIPFTLSPDDKTLYVTRNDEKDPAKLPAHILALDLASGKERQIFTMAEPGNAHFLLLTPDGSTLVGRRLDPKTQTMHICRLNVDGTGYREVYSIARKDFNDNFTLTADGRWIVLAKRKEGGNWQLIRIPIEGGAPESTGVELDGALLAGSIALSPDGSRIAFTTVKGVQELWSLDNVLSVLK